MTHSIKAQALAQYLHDQNMDDTDITEILEQYDNEQEFTANGEDLLILDEHEADTRFTDYILDSLWAFRAEFIADHVHKDRIDDYSDLIRSIQQIQEQCEGANSAIKAMIDDLEDFVHDAISADGRGHFLSSYDGNEYEASIKIDEKLEQSTGHPTFTVVTHHIYIYRT